MTVDSFSVIDALVQNGFAIVPNFVSQELVAGCLNDMQRLAEQDLLEPAGVGRGQARRTQADVRRDRIFWFGENEPEWPRRELLSLLDDFRLTLNRELYLGLESFEAHYAVYEPGGFYRKHVDVFRDNDSRTVSFILYLNDSNWTSEDGGQLRLYHSSVFTDVLPVGRTLVCFLSREIEHEVLEARRTRCSFTGWLKRRDAPAG